MNLTSVTKWTTKTAACRYSTKLVFLKILQYFFTCNKRKTAAKPTKNPKLAVLKALLHYISIFFIRSPQTTFTKSKVNIASQIPYRAVGIIFIKHWLKHPKSVPKKKEV